MGNHPNLKSIEVGAQEEDPDEMDEDEESMSLKDVIMTLNDFYSYKLEALLKLLEKYSDNEAKINLEEEFEKIEQVVKDNEVRIPYDEEIFIGIDKNYKILKKVLNQIRSKFVPADVEESEKDKIIKEKNEEIMRLQQQLKELEQKE